MPVAALSKGAGRNLCNSTKSRLRRDWSSFTDRGSPVAHTDAQGEHTPTAVTDPGLSSDTSRDAVSCELAALVGVGVTTR